MRWTKAAILSSLIAVPLVLLLAFGLRPGASTIASPLLLHPAPAFRLQTLHGTPYSSVQLRGHPTVLNFWASWCLECKIEHPYLVAAWHRYRSKGVRFVGVVYQDSRSSAQAFMQKHGGDWPSVLDPDGRTAINYGVYGVPETFFIDRDGIVRAKRVGPVTPEFLDKEIALLLGRANASKQ